MALEKADLARRTCKVVCQLVESLGGVCIRHPNIFFLAGGFVLQGCCGSFGWCMDLWLHDICHALLEWCKA